MKIDPINRDIIKALVKARLSATPKGIAKAVGIHPVTAQKRIEELAKAGIVQYRKRGIRTYCRISIAGLKKFMKKNS